MTRSAFREEFPQFFPQVWKTLVTDRTCMSLGRVFEAVIRAKERDFNTKVCGSVRDAIDTTGTRSLRLLVLKLEVRVSGGSNEGQAHVPAKYPPAQGRSWVSRAHEH